MTQNMQQLETFADQVVADVAATPSGVMTNIGHILVPPMTVHCCHCKVVPTWNCHRTCIFSPVRNCPGLARTTARGLFPPITAPVMSGPKTACGA